MEDDMRRIFKSDQSETLQKEAMEAWRKQAEFHAAYYWALRSHGVPQNNATATTQAMIAAVWAQKGRRRE